MKNIPKEKENLTKKEVLDFFKSALEIEKENFGILAEEEDLKTEAELEHLKKQILHYYKLEKFEHYY